MLFSDTCQARREPSWHLNWVSLKLRSKSGSRTGVTKLGKFPISSLNPRLGNKDMTLSSTYVIVAFYCVSNFR